MTTPDVRAILAAANKSFRQKWDHETWDDFYVAKAEWDLAALEAAGLVICAEGVRHAGDIVYVPVNTHCPLEGCDVVGPHYHRDTLDGDEVVRIP